MRAKWVALKKTQSNFYLATWLEKSKKFGRKKLKTTQKNR